MQILNTKLYSLLKVVSDSSGLPNMRAAFILPWSLTADAFLSARSHLLPTWVHWDALHLYNIIKVYWESATYYVYLFLKYIAGILHTFQALYNCHLEQWRNPAWQTSGQFRLSNKPQLLLRQCTCRELNTMYYNSNFISDTYHCISLTPTDAIIQPSKL